MFHKFVRVIKGITSDGSFETYINGLHRDPRSGGPTFDEARKDFRAVKSGSLRGF